MEYYNKIIRRITNCIFPMQREWKKRAEEGRQRKRQMDERLPGNLVTRCFAPSASSTWDHVPCLIICSHLSPSSQGLVYEMEKRMKTQPLPHLETIRKGWCHSLMQQHTKWDVVAQDSFRNTKDFVWVGEKRNTIKEIYFPSEISITKTFCSLKKNLAADIYRAEMREIKGHAASAHHIMTAKIEQMCCLWDPMQMFWVMSERHSSLAEINQFVNLPWRRNFRRWLLRLVWSFLSFAPEGLAVEPQYSSILQEPNTGKYMGNKLTE